MKNRTRILVLTLVMELIAVSVVGITLFTLFKTEASIQHHGMHDTVNNQARLLDSLVKLEPNVDEQARRRIVDKAISDHVKTSHEQFAGYTETGRLLIAKREGENFRLFFHDAFANEIPKLLFADVPAAEALRRAFAGLSGITYLTDYKGDEVISAFAPVPRLGVAVVAQVNMEEIRGPFVDAAINASVASLVLIFIGSVFFHRLAYPLVRHLEENELKYRTLFESANEGILVIGDVIEECNDQVCCLLGFTKDEIVGKSVVDFTPYKQPEGLPSSQVLRRYFSSALKGEPQYFYWHSRRKGGAVIDVDVSLKAIKLANRTILLATLLDITDRRRAELELRRAEQDISEQREQLAHVSRLSTMGEMAAGFAHEVNQPLTAINTYTQGLIRMMSNDNISCDDLKPILIKVSQQALRAGEIIRHLRDFVYKRDAGHEIVDCNQLVSDVVKLAEVEARQYDRQITVSLADSLPKLLVDPVQIKQVILNIVKNGLEAMEGAVAGLGVTVSTALDDIGEVRIYVEDCGPGFSEGDLLEIFNPFYTTKTNGMGMGLSISQSIIIAHGGDLIAENKELNGEIAGARFIIALPRAETDCQDYNSERVAVN